MLSRNVKLLGAISLVNDIASEMIFPLLPQFLLQVLGASKAELGMIEGAADSTASLLKLYSGGRSDQSGRRKRWLVVGYAIPALLRPLIGLAGAWWQVFGLRLADRLGKGLRTSPRDALIADSSTPETRGAAFGFHRSMDHLGAAIGPLLAIGFLALWPGEFRTLFLFTLIPGLAVGGLVIFGVRETTPQQAAQEAFHFTWRPFDKRFQRYMLAIALFTLGNSSDAFLLVRAGELGVPLFLIPMLWLVFHLAKSGGTMVAGRWVDRVGAKPAIFLGWLVYAIVYLLFGLATQAWHVWALFLAYAVYHALAEPAEKTLVTVLAGEQFKGLAFGWFNFAIGITTLPASVLFGFIYQQGGALAAFGTGASLALAACAILGTVKCDPPTPNLSDSH